jgi:flagellar basal body L-ring protein FlgH
MCARGVSLRREKVPVQRRISEEIGAENHKHRQQKFEGKARVKKGDEIVHLFMQVPMPSASRPQTKLHGGFSREVSPGRQRTPASFNLPSASRVTDIVTCCISAQTNSKQRSNLQSSREDRLLPVRRTQLSEIST